MAERCEKRLAPSLKSPTGEGKVIEVERDFSSEKGNWRDY